VEPTSDTIPAPRAQVSADGTTATAGSITLEVSDARAIDAHGATVTVTGRGYDTFKGVYVAFCVQPKRNQAPTPCGGGAATEGSTGVSQWVSSNPPPYGRGLSIPYGPDGSFTATLTVEAALAPRVDCRKVQCVIATRNDHTRSTDRSQDVFVPVAFTGSKLATATTGASGSSSSDGTSLAVPVAAGAVVVIAAVVGGTMLARRRRSRGRAIGTATPTTAGP
jgi:hypothetical protein